MWIDCTCDILHANEHTFQVWRTENSTEWTTKGTKKIPSICTLTRTTTKITMYRRFFFYVTSYPLWIKARKKNSCSKLLIKEDEKTIRKTS